VSQHPFNVCCGFSRHHSFCFGNGRAKKATGYEGIASARYERSLYSPPSCGNNGHAVQHTRPRQFRVTPETKITVNGNPGPRSNLAGLNVTVTLAADPAVAATMMSASPSRREPQKKKS